MMRLNNIADSGAKKRRTRVGRGSGSGFGKTSGRGQKGQKSRSGGYHKTGFEGGQMPLQRRLPKVGFSSHIGQYSDEVRTHELVGLEGEIGISELRAAGIINRRIKRVKIIMNGAIEKAITLKGVRVTKGARQAIEAAGGKVIE